MPTLDETRAWVRELFDGVTDKGGKPYADHCFRVEAGLPAEADEDERHAALLHDVIEDKVASGFEMTRRGYSPETIWLVLCLTREVGQTYAGYIDYIAALGHRGLIQIKLSDNRDNSDPARIACLPPEQRSIAKRYAKARAVLESALALSPAQKKED